MVVYKFTKTYTHTHFRSPSFAIPAEAFGQHRLRGRAVHRLRAVTLDARGKYKTRLRGFPWTGDLASLLAWGHPGRNVILKLVFFSMLKATPGHEFANRLSVEKLVGQPSAECKSYLALPCKPGHFDRTGPTPMPREIPFQKSVKLGFYPAARHTRTRRKKHNA